MQALYLGHGQVIMSHRILWDVITYKCHIYLHMASTALLVVTQLYANRWVCAKQTQKGMLPWWPLLGLPTLYPIIESSHCNSFEDQVPVDFIYGYLIFKWVAVAWYRWEGIRIIVPAMATRSSALFQCIATRLFRTMPLQSMTSRWYMYIVIFDIVIYFF